MKTKIFPLLFSLFFILNTFSVNAQVSNHYITDGYTPEGVYYMVYEEETNNAQSRAIGDTIEVTRKFYYTAVIKPPATRTYTEKINGITYTGTIAPSYPHEQEGILSSISPSALLTVFLYSLPGSSFS
ncbi:MAG: hypothetical protein IJX63_03680 [Lachnospiraceae bacterium]|nr:hypothetical protein [Lachnospiraceae bacterium]